MEEIEEERRGEEGILTAISTIEDLTCGGLPRRLTSTSSSLCKQDQSPLPYRALTVKGMLKCGYDELLNDAVPLVVVFASLCGLVYLLLLWKRDVSISAVLSIICWS